MADFHPLVSIVVPVYNGSNYMREAIDSALAQTYDNVEIIVVNDGSTDGTESIALSYGDKIRYFAKSNGGTSTALNLGILNMRGEYFSWLSHDDMYYPNKIKRSIEELSKLDNKDTIIRTDLDGINDKYEKIYETNYASDMAAWKLRKESYLYPIVHNQTHGCTLLISKRVFDTVGIFDEKWLVAQDFEFFYRAFKVFPNKLISEVLVTARDAPGRQGLRSKVQGNIDYSRLWINMVESLTEDEIYKMDGDRYKLLSYMEVLCAYAGYTIGSEYVKVSFYKLTGEWRMPPQYSKNNAQREESNEVSSEKQELVSEKPKKTQYKKFGKVNGFVRMCYGALRSIAETLKIKDRVKSTKLYKKIYESGYADRLQ
jgi:glycosyltransferase involved in cell wall biosynthesis